MSKDLCRICAKNVPEKDPTKLFSNQNQKLLLQIKDLTGVRLKNSFGLPKIICCKCKKDLCDAYKFRVNFLKVQETFKVKSTRGNKKQTCDDELVEATEFVQVFVVKEEKNTTPNDHDESYGENEEEEINIGQSDDLNKKQNLTFIKNDGDEINALELKPNEENTLEDTKITIEEVSYDKVYDDYMSAKSLSEDEDDMANKESDEDYSPENNKTVKTNKSKLNNKIQNTNVEPSDRENVDLKGKRQPKKKRKEGSGEQSNIFICDQCGNHFTCRHHFKLHLRRHTGDKRCACELCPDKFFTSSELRRHMRRHTGERPFACKYCDRRFTDYSTRIKHERTHTNERPFMCSQCGKSFTTSYILKNHMLTHTGERHFKCDVCNKAFTRRTHLVVHFRSIMHKQAVEKDKRPNSQDELQQSHCSMSQSKHTPNFLV